MKHAWCNFMKAVPIPSSNCYMYKGYPVKFCVKCPNCSILAIPPIRVHFAEKIYKELERLPPPLRRKISILQEISRKILDHLDSSIAIQKFVLIL